MSRYSRNNTVSRKTVMAMCVMTCSLVMQTFSMIFSMMDVPSLSIHTHRIMSADVTSYASLDQCEQTGLLIKRDVVTHSIEDVSFSNAYQRHLCNIHHTT